MGIKNEDREKKGWWGKNPPDFLDQFNAYKAEDLAVGSPACASQEWQDTELKGRDKVLKQWNESRDKCAKTGYKSAHLYVSLSRDAHDAVAVYMEQNDPLKKRSGVPAQAIQKLHAINFVHMAQVIRDLVEDCFVLDYININVHGNKGVLIPDQEDKWASIQDVLRLVVPPCALSPIAHVEFGGCYVACDSGAELIRKTLAGLYANPDYQAQGSHNQIKKIEYLFNEAKGITEYLFDDRDNLPEHLASITKINRYSNYDEGIVYAVEGAKVTPDRSTDPGFPCYKDEGRHFEATGLTYPIPRPANGSPAPPPAAPPAPTMFKKSRIPPIIAFPIKGITVIRDPHVPAEKQRFSFIVKGDANQRLVWVLNGKRLGLVSQIGSWPMMPPGSHQLSLQDEQGRVLDSVQFTVIDKK